VRRAKPVQRRILYAMERMGLSFSGNAGAKPVKSARVVGDVLGKFHPHSDQAAYDALVRMAQIFRSVSLIDGQGTSVHATATARLRCATPSEAVADLSLLLDELDEGTVEFTSNYDGSTQEPSCFQAAAFACCSTARAASRWVWQQKSPRTSA